MPAFLWVYVRQDPAHDLQAMDRRAIFFTSSLSRTDNSSIPWRAFRFGQTRDASVYRLLGAGSVEELIYARQIYKQQQMEIGYNASIQTRSGIAQLTLTSFPTSSTVGAYHYPMCRYFKGVQGDNAKQGELFGIANIFKLHEDQLATKMVVWSFLEFFMSPCMTNQDYCIFGSDWEGQSSRTWLGFGQYGN